MANLEVITDEQSTLKFRLHSVHVSIANSIRRILLSEISMVVVITYPHNENQCNITINNTRFTNEMIKQRISSIPIHIPEDKEIVYEGKQEEDEQDNIIVQPIWKSHKIQCKKKNTSDQMIFITSEDLELVNKTTGEIMSKVQRDIIFPPDEHGYFIDILRLRPQLANSIPGEEIEFTCDMSISNAKDDAMFNAVSKATYGNTLDNAKANEVWKAIEKETITTKENWFLLDARRYYIPNSFDFTIETVGVHSNKRLLYLAIHKMIDKLTNITQDTEIPINESISTIKNCYDVILQNEDYTLGKVLEYLLYSMYFEGPQASLTYLGFKKDHPHDDDSIIRIAFKEPIEKNMVREKLIRAAVQGINIYNSIASQVSSL